MVDEGLGADQDAGLLIYIWTEKRDVDLLKLSSWFPVSTLVIFTDPYFAIGTFLPLCK